jgi:hypothetical protein
VIFAPAESAHALNAETALRVINQPRLLFHFISRRRMRLFD